MRKVFIALTILLLSFSFLMDFAYAGRFGGGRSFGAQRSFSAPISRSTNATGGFMRNQSGRFAAPLLGLIAGGLIGSLLLGHGLASGLLSWILVLGGLYFAFHVFRTLFANQRQPQQPYYQTQRASNPFQEALSRLNPQMNRNTAHSSSSEIDETEFLRNAKVTFLRLQTAYDEKDLADIKRYTTPEVYAEIQMQLQERGDAFNKTEVSALTADLLPESNDEYAKMVSVRFSGLVKENNATAVSFSEIWHFQKAAGEWRIAGIQQDTH